jgi:DNA polymerase III epsilon subunit-like protein
MPGDQHEHPEVRTDGGSEQGTVSQETRHLMVDIETLGTEPGCAILSVGSVQFTLADGLGYQFHEHVDLVSCEEAGLSLDADTVQWWATQENVSDVLAGGEDLEAVLTEFVRGAEECDVVWANSPSFDLAILKTAGEAVGVEMPWAFYEERDFRTLKNLPNVVEVEHEGTEHDALDDAIYQARYALENLRRWSE